MTDIRLIRIFLSSPGDVADERALALKAIDQLPYDPFLRGRIAIDVVAWEKPGAGTPMLATMTPQEAINQGLPKPSECDIVVVIFWSRMGTPLPEEYRKPEAFCFPTGDDLPEWRYLSGTEWEYVDALSAAQQTGKPAVVVYRRMEDPSITMRDPQRDAKIEQWKRVETFFATFVNPDGSIRQGYNQYQTPDELQEQFESHLKGLVKRLIEEPSRPAEKASAIVSVENAPLWEGSPFPGLRAFTPDDAPIFFGRGRETDELITKVSESRFVAVVGTSGSGKSSLVAAGLLPRLADNAISSEGVGSKDWRVVAFKPGEAGGNPFEALYDALLRVFPSLRPQPLEAPRQKREFLVELAQNPSALADTCQAALADQPDWAEVLLFIDQFEETFTQVGDAAVRRAFVAMLEAVAQAERMRIVLTLRADFYYRCVEYQALAHLLRTGNFPLAAPGERALAEMITRPAERAGLRWEADDLPERILQDTGQEPGALPLMAYALDELYKASGQGDSRMLSSAAYEELGGVRGAIGTRAENVFAAQGEEAQAALPRIFRDLVEVDERGTFTRKRAPLGHVTDTTAKAQLVNALTEARLLVHSRGEEDQPVVEVAHEALLQHWRRLEDWLEEAREDLIILKNVREDAATWIERGRKPDDDGLYRGTVLEEKLAWVKRNDLRQDQQTVQDALAFIDMSQQHEVWVAKKERRRRRRYQLAWIMFIVALVGLLVYFFGQNQDLQTEKGVLEADKDALVIRQERVATLAAGGVFVPFDESQSHQETFDTATKIAELNKWDKENPVIDATYKEQYGVEMVKVPAGCFWMGSITGRSDEQPVHEVCFEEPFWIDRYEVTNTKYKECVDAGACGPSIDFGEKFNGEQQPVAAVTWDQAFKYCAWRKAQLPTEAQWEYAARGPDSLVYPWGNEWKEENAVTGFNSGGNPANVGSKPNGVSWVGAYDLAGNVWEWTNTIYDPEQYPYPYNPDDGREENIENRYMTRVMRGGSWYEDNPDLLRGAYRVRLGPERRFSYDGFRCARLQ